MFGEHSELEVKNTKRPAGQIIFTWIRHILVFDNLILFGQVAVLGGASSSSSGAPKAAEGVDRQMAIKEA